jgi:16S rRNA (uracil1498-N3)-methyltransferase
MAQLQRLVVTPAQISNQVCTLTAEQQHYLSRVLRLHSGDRFIVMDGQGQGWLAELIDPLTQAKLLSAIQAETELPLAVTLAIALPKGNGMDEVVRQATELGVSRIVPILSDRTLLNPSTQKLERWCRIAQEAAEQSERQFVPTIQAPIAFLSYLQDVQSLSAPEGQSLHYLCVARRSAPSLLSCLTASSQSAPAPASITVITGPEGGWTEAEVEAAIAAGCQPVSLGKRILRAVTAPIAALALIAATHP